MNTNMLKPAKLLMVDENGMQTELNGTIELEELDTMCIDEMNLHKYAPITTVSMNIKIDNAKTITRKRLIKLLMSKGIQRNGAAEIAKYLLKKNGKYTMFDLMMW